METIMWITLLIFLHILVFIYVKRKSPKDIKGKHVVVTGGSSGIGLQTAVLCAQKGANVTVVARNVKLLEKSVELLNLNRVNDNQKFSYKSIDLGVSYENVAKSFEEIEAEMGPIYMLVNCAGMAICGAYEDVSVDDVKKLMDVNYFSTYYCVRYVLPKMKSCGDGIIVIVGSISSLVGLYGYGPYSAAKFALRGMAETIAMECKHKGVSVTLALPCDTDTPGFENEEKSKPKETKMLSEQGGLAKPQDVAKRLVDDALAGSFFSVLGFESWMITVLCCGMAPWGNVLQKVIQVILIGPFRLVGIIVNWNFLRIIKNCSKEKSE